MSFSINHGINSIIRGTIGDAVVSAVIDSSASEVSESQGQSEDEKNAGQGKDSGKRPVRKVDVKEVPDVVRHEIYKHIFGNVASTGASADTEYPDIDKKIPDIKPSEDDDPVKLKFNLKVIVDMIKYKSELSTDHCRGKTLRQLCVPFAREARLFLKEIYDLNGEVSNLAQKMPQLTERAPWVAFDFNSGLNFKDLSSKERRVIQTLNKRLLATSSKNATTDAHISSVEVDLTI